MIRFAATIVEPKTPALSARGSFSALVSHRYCSADQFAAVCSGVGEDWFTQRERAERDAWRDPARQQVWLVGRVLARQLIAEALSDCRAPSTIEILSRDENGRSCRPRMEIDGAGLPWSLSISHTDCGVLAALCRTPGMALGVDLAATQAMSQSLIRMWFTPAEQAWVEQSRAPRIAAFIWAGKEAIYKACNCGESFAPRDVEIFSDGRVTYRGAAVAGHVLRSYLLDGHVAVLATGQPTLHSLQSSITR